MDSIVTGASLYSTVFGVLGLAGAGFAFFRYSYFKSTLELLRQDRDDSSVRAETAKRDLKEMKDRCTAQDVLLTEKNQEIHILRNVVTGKDQLDRIEKLLLDFVERVRNGGSNATD